MCIRDRDQNGLADTGTAEQTDLTALGVGADQIHDLYGEMTERCV